jgi:glutathione S-transferase
MTLLFRFALGLKKLAYQTVWVDIQDIESKAKAIGAPPSQTNADGSEVYTVPIVVVETPSSPTPVVLSNSATIVRYLDKIFPDPSATLFPAETRVLDSVYSQFHNEKVAGRAVGYVLPAVVDSLPVHCQKWYKDTRKRTFGVPYDVLAPNDSAARAEKRRSFEEAFDNLAILLDAGGKGNYRLSNGKVTYAEIELAAIVWWIRASDRNEDGAWAILKERNDGRWAKLLEVPEYKALAIL